MPKSLIISFIPWILYFAVSNSNTHSQILATSIACLTLIIFQRRELSKKFIFDWATLLFFVTLLIMFIFLKNAWLANHANTLSNIILALIAWFSLSIRLPFTLQYAREQVDRAYWKTPLFLQINYIITGAWAFSLTLIAIQNVLALYSIANDMWAADIFPAVLIILTVLFTLKFPDWYKHRLFAKGGVAQIATISTIKIAHLHSADIAYRTLGTGQPLILAAGSYMTMHQWDPSLLQRLARYFNVIIYDYPDIGRSISKTEHRSIMNLADTTYELIVALNLKQTLVLGYSMGGWVAQVLAAKFPAVISQLILIASDYGGNQSISPSAEVLQLFSQPIEDPQAYGKALMPFMFPSNLLSSMAAKMKTIFMSASLESSISSSQINSINQLTKNWHTQTVKNPIMQPTLILTGDDDKITPTENSLVLQRQIRQAELYQFTNAGHGVIYQYPQEIADKIYQFVKTH
jgi:pimeloyl-ACP methyl ester carboxylesterase